MDIVYDIDYDAFDSHKTRRWRKYTMVRSDFSTYCEFRMIFDVGSGLYRTPVVQMPNVV